MQTLKFKTTNMQQEKQQELECHFMKHTTGTFNWLTAMITLSKGNVAALLDLYSCLGPQKHCSCLWSPLELLPPRQPKAHPQGAADLQSCQHRSFCYYFLGFLGGRGAINFGSPLKLIVCQQFHIKFRQTNALLMRNKANL